MVWKNLPRSQQAAGIATLVAMVLAIVLDNTSARTWYDNVHHMPVSVRVGTFKIDKPLILWINDGLMVFFFILIALELKREALEGQLSSVKAITTPAIAAAGGMIMPVLIYIAFNLIDPVAMRGWAIPAATDAVLALTVLTLLGTRIPSSLKVFLTALAIIDDLGAILVIAAFYTEQLSIPSLVLAAIGLTVLAGLNFFNITRMAAYVIVGLFLWLSVLKSGVHATLAGVAIGLAIPAKVLHDGQYVSPLRETEHALYPWVALGVVPIFAFFNSGIILSADTVPALMTPTSLGIVLGLFIGKQTGIFGAVWFSVRLGFSELPKNASWPQLYGVAIIAGIGFTMSLFIAGLAFSEPESFRNARLSVVVGSLLSAVSGTVILLFANHKRMK